MSVKMDSVFVSSGTMAPWATQSRGWNSFSMLGKPHRIHCSRAKAMRPGLVPLLQLTALLPSHERHKYTAGFPLDVRKKGKDQQRAAPPIFINRNVLSPRFAYSLLANAGMVL